LTQETNAGARRLLVIEHDPDAPAGVLGDWATRRGLAVETARLHAGDRLPPASEPGAVAVLGSERTAWDDTVPWLAGEMSYLETVLAGSVPVLGICFGGQLLARLSGARLYRLPEPEIGWVHARSLHPALAPGPWVTWHCDAFDVPPGGAVLATSDACVQAFSLGPHAGVQFHPEATAPIVGSWLASGDPAHGRAGTAAFPATDRAWPQAADHARALFSAWLDGDLAIKPA
jgi:GMP synthase-like glutamine amidotransferase